MPAALLCSPGDIAKLQEARELYVQPDRVFVSFDIEAYERHQHLLTEIGWSVFDTRLTTLENTHYIIQENSHLRNGRYVPDNRHRFDFGDSQYASLAQALDEFRALLARYPRAVLVGHGVASDFKYLRRQNFHFRDDFMTVDTQQLYRAFANVRSGTGLAKVLTALSIRHGNLHNAGNDARYTLQAMLAMVTRPWAPPTLS
ncbi:hypothetical protein IWQ60_005166 [Tieghemiomyces parasiticus]|uniref:Exonuclease domain-containing protein n=1 Tax=Tieghemiomyces parasiticus TaxID=78921 RepID=A0A9W8A9M3_9FUNG|nr:hypothetical protein IWQ60_005166 [Tieghemiomyces parasiticus]